MRNIRRPKLAEGINTYRRTVAIAIFELRKEAGIHRQTLTVVLNGLGVHGWLFDRAALRRYETGETNCPADKYEAIKHVLKTLITNR